MVAVRDLKCGNDVGRMAALGRYAEEFIVYGLSYKEKGTICHRVSSDQKEIWRFVEACERNAIHPTRIEEWVNRTLVPSGQKDEYLMKTKVSMAQKLKVMYSADFFAKFGAFAQQGNTNDAYSFLLEWQDELIGCFEREKLEQFKTLVQFAYSSKKLNVMSYEKLQQWLEHIFRQMEDDVVLKKNFNRTFYGVGYIDLKGEKKYYTNANKSLVWKQKQKLMSEDIMTSPIWQKTYWYDWQPNLMQTKEEFINYIGAWLDHHYWEKLEVIKNLPSAISSDEYLMWLEELTNANNKEQIQTAKYYKNCWQIQ